jgi:hypothetical protein
MSVAPVLGPIGSLAEHAVAYAQAGLEIFPVNPHDKTPIVSQYKATTDIEQVGEWWRIHPTALIGHRIPRDQVILDIDPRHGGKDTWNAIRAELGGTTFPNTRGHMSGRGDGGGHTWWLNPGIKLSVTNLDTWAEQRGHGHPILHKDGTPTGRWTGGIDLLHHNHRYTILPPSPHPDTGQPYRWIDGRGLDTPPGVMPQLLVDLVTDDQPYTPPAPPLPRDPDSIADWYTDTYTWGDLLRAHGWTLRGGDGEHDRSRWRHPTATSAFSATLKYGCLFVYSPNTPFEVTAPSSPQGYTLFRAWAILEHHGDMGAAASAARAIKDPTPIATRLIQSSNGSSVTSPLSLNSLTDIQPWPVLDQKALHGPIGEAAKLLEPHTEADLTAVLATLLTGWGASLGRAPHAVAGHVHHPARLSVAIVGETSKARKGTSWATSRLVLDKVDPAFMATRVIGGFGSGESVVDEVRDAEPNDDPNKPDDPGAKDKRLLIHEPEFARVLKVCARESSVLSTIIRDAWDGTQLQARARTRRAVATAHHIAIVGHITAPELRRNLNETEIAGGFANRILWICARRSKLLPFGDSLSAVQLSEIGMTLRRAKEEAGKRAEVTFTPEARDRWESLYTEMAEDDPGGLLGAIVARPEPQCLRLALLYALLDGSKGIDTTHIEAAWALWSYSRASAAYIWGDAIGDQIADALLAAIRRAGPEGMDLTSQSAEFSRKVPAKRLAAARSELETTGLIETVQEATEGRPRTVSRVLAKQAKQAKKGTGT